jgi:hypothetical protein
VGKWRVDELTLIDLAPVPVQHRRRYLVVELSEHIILQESDLNAKKPEELQPLAFRRNNRHYPVLSGR